MGVKGLNFTSIHLYLGERWNSRMEHKLRLSERIRKCAHQPTHKKRVNNLHRSLLCDILKMGLPKPKKPEEDGAKGEGKMASHLVLGVVSTASVQLLIRTCIVAP
jgi:hypothetical protein